MKKFMIVCLLSVALVSGCSDTEERPSTPDPDMSSDEQENGGQNDEQDDQENIDEAEQEEQEIIDEPESVAENLEIPWTIEKEGETFFLTERTGSITRVEDGEAERQKVELERELSLVPEARLLGFVLDPEFLENDTAYAYYTYEGSNGPMNRIVTLQLGDGVWQEENVLLDEIPSGRVHHGGRMKIGPDDKLYATTGDASVPELAQDLDSLAGKILRMERDGSVPADNPYSDSYVYSYGHRNPQGLTWSSDGTLYASEHGNDANDEINRIEAGENYGWPIIEGNEEEEGMITPIFTSGEDETWAPSGMAYYEGKLYVAGLRGSAVYVFDIEAEEQREVISGFGRIRDVVIEDELLYFISNNTDGRGDPEENDDQLYRRSVPE
ncbi:Glucose/arabinose dehydrogenase, beta-propeller fold [Alkalibacterium putridalgicola]|uniref:Dehydrogenase n=1 Tax=Alkalibacterium putridalgicola TaxID=426703 RepID=A0A1H7UJC6_9LACT|nr:sorbosone dehydrogenase family protein [Alkalibacterium putridalgicola]GEK88274.1 dehydrogenase [Alkalibacterium putridalgicola]SEL96805.1 Glucose/arabinose dehydrogenase, beta-propeller fold [Alkalibacterium putridalgicola]